MHDAGWAAYLGNLKTVLEGGKDVRPSVLGMKVG
jgi:hypothetical protein